MKTTLDIAGLRCSCYPVPGATSVTYLLYPMELPGSWMEAVASRCGSSMLVVTDMDWQDVFSPWPAHGIPQGTPDFEGLAPEFLILLRQKILPQIEDSLGIGPEPERTLVGVSMSGLFAMWQWMLCDDFRNIVCLSGSFWYPGFVQWLTAQKLPQGKGKCIVLLGNGEHRSRVPEFRSVAADTAEVVRYLKSEGADVQFISVPGDHYSDALQRLAKALGTMFGVVI